MNAQKPKWTWKVLALSKQLAYTLAAIFLLFVTVLFWAAAIAVRELSPGLDLPSSALWTLVALMSGWTFLRVLPIVQGRFVVGMNFRRSNGLEDTIHDLRKRYPTARVRMLTLRPWPFSIMVDAAGLVMAGAAITAATGERS